jgi:hypothetical protein
MLVTAINARLAADTVIYALDKAISATTCEAHWSNRPEFLDIVSKNVPNGVVFAVYIEPVSTQLGRTTAARYIMG